MDQQRRAFASFSIHGIVMGAGVVLLLAPRGSSFAQDLGGPGQFVGLSGQIGTYEEVQANLEHLEWQEVQQTTEKPSHVLKDLYDGQMAWRGALENVEVSFEYSMQRYKDTARVIVQKQQKRAVPDNFSFEARVAMKGEKRFTHIRFTTPAQPSNAIVGTPRSNQRARGLGEFVYAYNGAEMKSFEPFRSMGHIHRAKLDAVDSHHVWYFDSISIPTGARAARQSESAWYVPVALGLSSVYQLLPTLQVVDGFPCHVATSGADTIWIDVAHGFAMRRRVWFQMTNAARAPVLAFIYANKDFRQYAKRIWLPHKCYRLDFAGALEPPNTQGQLTEVHTISAKTINVNTVKDELFELDFPGGTNVMDLVKNKSYVVPHGEHLLDEVIARANPIVNGRVQPLGSASSSRSVWRQLLILNGVVLLLFGGRALWHRRRADVKAL
jgi:hypothetical protein